jgi:hypothetical protein
MKKLRKHTLLAGFTLFLLLLPFWIAAAETAGYALEFDGHNDYVLLAGTAAMLGSGWETSKTVEVWVWPDGPGEVCAHEEPAWCNCIFGDRPRWWGISRGVLLGQDRIWIWNTDGDLPTYTDAVGVEYTPGEWVHITLVHANGILRAYKNGVEVGAVASGSTAQPATGALPDLQIGGVINNADRVWIFKGLLDEVRLWNFGRTPAEVQADLYHTLAGTETGLKAYYQMSDGSGMELTDDSGHGWDGKLMDGNVFVPPDGHPPTWVNSTAFDGAPPATPTNTPIPPTDTPIPPTDTPVPPTDTPIPPTDTPIPPTDTPIPPTDTPVPPTDTPIPPTNTPVPPTDTPVPPTETQPPPTATVTPQTNTPPPPATPSPTISGESPISVIWAYLPLNFRDIRPDTP